MAGYPVNLISATSLIMIQYLSTHAEVDGGEETTVVRRNHLSDQPIKPFMIYIRVEPRDIYYVFSVFSYLCIRIAPDIR